jgi:hypothetical protein
MMFVLPAIVVSSVLDASAAPCAAGASDPWSFARAVDSPLLVRGVSATHGTDPTEPVTRVELTLDHQDRQNGEEADVFTARFDLGLAERLAFRFDAPFANVASQGASSDEGLGDVRAQLGWRAFDEPGFSMFVGAAVIFNTASEESLGEGKNQFVPYIAASGALPDIHSRLFEVFEHFSSFSGDPERGGITESKLQLHLMTKWNDSVWTQLGGAFFMDWLGGEHGGITADAEVGMATSANLAFWVRPGVGLVGEDVPGVYDWSVLVGVRWLF